MTTALSATIGTGNIVGVASAMVLGEPGAIIWMFIVATFGISTKYAESVLAIKYRESNEVVEGRNMIQSNSIASAFEAGFGLSTSITGIILVVFSLAFLMRGVRSIGKVSSVIVPAMAFFYLLFTLIIIFKKLENIPAGVALMIQMAFSTEAVTGGNVANECFDYQAKVR